MFFCAVANARLFEQKYCKITSLGLEFGPIAMVR